LRAFGFICHVEPAHKYLVVFLKRLGATEVVEFTQDAWNLCNDAHFTPLTCLRSPEAIACGCIFLAARRRGIPLHEEGDNDDEGDNVTGWWEAFGATIADIQEVVTTLLDLYTTTSTPAYHALTCEP